MFGQISTDPQSINILIRDWERTNWAIGLIDFEDYGVYGFVLTSGSKLATRPCPSPTLTAAIGADIPRPIRSILYPIEASISTYYTSKQSPWQAWLNGEGPGPLPPAWRPPLAPTAPGPSGPSSTPWRPLYRHIIHQNNPHDKPNLMVKVPDLYHQPDGRNRRQQFPEGLELLDPKCMLLYSYRESLCKGLSRLEWARFLGPVLEPSPAGTTRRVVWTKVRVH